MKILIVGCGYIGSALAFRLREKAELWGVTSSPRQHQILHDLGVKAIAADVQKADWTRQLPAGMDAIVNTIASGGRDYREIYWKSNCDLLRLYSERPPKAFIYTSSTSVYSQTGGETVTEQDEAEPSSPLREVLLETEKMLLESAEFPSISVLRLGGIYGPGRHALLDDLRRGIRSFSEDPNRWINQIHRDDAAAAIEHVLGLAPKREIFNVCDDEPARYASCLNWLAKHLGIEPPEFDPDAEPARARRGPKPNRRISNAKLKAAGWRPRHPSFREGFEQIFREEANHVRASETQDV